MCEGVRGEEGGGWGEGVSVWIGCVFMCNRKREEGIIIFMHKQLV